MQSVGRWRAEREHLERGSGLSHGKWLKPRTDYGIDWPVCSKFARQRAHPAAHCKASPHTLHPTPYTLHPTPYTLHPTPYTLHPTPYTLHPAGCRAPNPKPHPATHTLRAACQGVGCKAQGVLNHRLNRAVLNAVSCRFPLSASRQDKTT